MYMNMFWFLCVGFLLATQLNYLQEENLLAPNCVCMVKKTVTSMLPDGRYVFLLCFTTSVC